MEEKIILRESYPGDSEKLGVFFSQIPTQGLIDFKIRRPIDFFSMYERLRLKYHTYLLEEISTAENEAQREILGTASFLLQPCRIQQTTTQIAYACDLRISPQRKAILNWSKYFLPQLEELTAKEKVEHFVTTINLDNTQVINAFIRTKQKKTIKPFYELIRKFNLVSIHGFYPLLFKLNPSINVGYLQKSDQAALAKYIAEKLNDYELIPQELSDSVENFIQNSYLYSFSNFIVAKDTQNKIVGCCYPLSSSLLQDYFPQSYNEQAHNFRQFLKFASWLKIARALTKPFSRTQKDQALNFQHLHFLHFEHPEVLKTLTAFAFSKSKQNEFLVYSYENSLFNYRPPIGTVHAESPYALYEIRTPDALEDQTKKSLKNKITKKVWLDGFLF